MPVDYKKYDKSWFDVIRPEALKRAGHKCEVCKCSQHSQYVLEGKVIVRDLDEHAINWYQSCGLHVKKVHLSVAHLNHDISDNSPNNLKVMCQRCHLAYDKEKHKIARMSRYIKYKG